jgi:hypothetical protein
MMPIVINSSITVPSANSSLLPNSLRHDWYGNPVEHPIHFSLALTAECLCITVQIDKTPVCHPRDGINPFVTGLWEYDVFELFIKQTDSATYTEINLGAKGSWWACHFSDYRIARASDQSKEMPPARFEQLSDKGWHASYTIPLAAAGLPKAAEWHKLSLQVTAIQHYPEFPVYLAWNTPVDREPDFHYLAHLDAPSFTFVD